MLVQFGLGNEARREFRNLVIEALRPKELDPETPIEIVLDWYEDHGFYDVKRMVLESMKSEEDYECGSY
jgi:hypothetical protein